MTDLSESHLCPSGENFTVDEVRAHLRAEIGDERGDLQKWALRHKVSKQMIAWFLLGSGRLSRDVARAAGFEPVTVYRPLTPAGRHALTQDRGGRAWVRP